MVFGFSLVVSGFSLRLFQLFGSFFDVNFDFFHRLGWLFDFWPASQPFIFSFLTVFIMSKTKTNKHTNKQYKKKTFGLVEERDIWKHS